jgi:serine/threonine protein phosphatase 1
MDAPHVSRLRIGLDTGAFSSGLLTAIGLEGTARWLVSVQGEPADDPA